jgi:ABC-type glutathione transport system ATPase component
MANDVLLRVQNLQKLFALKRGFFWGEPARVHAVDGVSFDLLHGETLGLVGESGCGKSTTGRLILRLIEPTAGEVFYEQTPIFQTGKKEMRALRQRMQIIFQDPYSSLNPRMTIQRIVGEPLRRFGLVPPGGWRGWHELYNEDVTLAETLQDAGYTTALFSDVYHQWKPGKNFQRGFDTWQVLRGQEAERKLERTEENMRHIGGILEEVRRSYTTLKGRRRRPRPIGR